MSIEPNLAEFERLARPGTIVPLTRRVTADLFTPVTAYLRLARAAKYSFLLESVEGGEKIARYTFIGANPFRVVRARGREITIEEDGRVEHRRASIFELLRELVRGYRPVRRADLPPLVAGAVGYLGYDTVRLLERLPERATDDLGLDDAVLMFFSELVAFDHVKHQILVMANVFCAPGESRTALRRKYNAAHTRIERTTRLLERSGIVRGRRPQPARDLRVASNFRKAGYLAAVRRAKRYIRAGDIYQAVLSQRFERRLAAQPFDVYRALRVVNPSPYMYFLRLGGLTVFGSSPEMLVKVSGREAFYRPIAGTRQRGRNEAEDALLEAELLADEKERAEHIMLVDLGRNDLGRVSEYGSVRVEALGFVERYSHVMHLVSSLRSRLRTDSDAFDVLAACFPAGTVTGAPKVRAMEIIEEQEPTRRGVYAGSVLYLDYSGNLDSCIAIRTMVVKNGRAYVQAGGGIVADSRPEREYQETVNKARALIAAIEMAERGL